MIHSFKCEESIRNLKQFWGCCQCRGATGSWTRWLQFCTTEVRATSVGLVLWHAWRHAFCSPTSSRHITDFEPVHFVERSSVFHPPTTPFLKLSNQILVVLRTTQSFMYLSCHLLTRNLKLEFQPDVGPWFYAEKIYDSDVDPSQLVSMSQVSCNRLESTAWDYCVFSSEVVLLSADVQYPCYLIVWLIYPLHLVN